MRGSWVRAKNNENYPHPYRSHTTARHYPEGCRNAMLVEVTVMISRINPIASVHA